MLSFWLGITKETSLNCFLGENLGHFSLRINTNGEQCNIITIALQEPYCEDNEELN